MTEQDKAKENQGRREEAQDPDREGGVGRRETPPGQKPEPNQDLPKTTTTTETTTETPETPA